MRFLKAIGVVLAGVVLMVPPAFAADAAAVRTTMEKSGLVAQYVDLGAQIRDGLLRSPPPTLPPGTVSLMATIVGNTMDGKKLLDDVQTVLAASLSDDEVTAMDAFFDSDLGSRIVKAEIAGAALSVQDEIGANVQALIAAAHEDPERAAVFERIDKMLNSSELSARSSESLLKAMSMAMAESGPMPPDPDKLAQVDQRIDAMHDALVKQAHTMILATAQRLYCDFSTAEMERYTGFLATDPSQIMYAAVSGVIDGFYAETGKRIGAELAAAIRQQKT